MSDPVEEMAGAATALDQKSSRDVGSAGKYAGTSSLETLQKWAIKMENSIDRSVASAQLKPARLQLRCCTSGTYSATVLKDQESP